LELEQETAMGTKKTVTNMGLDCHRKFSQVSARDPRGRIVWRQRLEHADRAALRQRLGQWPKVPVVLEGSFGWGWMSDELSAAGLEPHLANCRKVEAWRREVQGSAKSNRIDADLLGELWSQPRRGDGSHWWEVWLAPPEVREQREWLRYRMGLVQVQTMLKNRIHATLHRHGIVQPHSDLFGTAGRRFLSLLVGDARQDLLPASGRATLKGLLVLLDQVRRLVAQATRQFRREVNASPAARRLMTLPGVSWILAYTILAEIGSIERFLSARHLASYGLLVPRADDSGEDDPQRGGRRIGHAGRQTLQWAFIEAAHGAVKSSPRLRGIFDRRTDGGTREKNRGYIAVANELCRIAYLLWSKQVDYREIAEAAPHPSGPQGRSARSKSSKTHPAGVESCHAMAAANA